MSAKGKESSIFKAIKSEAITGWRDTQKETLNTH